ncbi:MAG: hypothetical protein ABI222_11705, partial [Opitutaceae bacterium]
GYHESVATVSPGHKGFYKLVGFRPFGSPRSYSQKLNDPVVALAMNLDRYRQPATPLNETERFLHQLGGSGNHFLGHVAGWTNQAAHHFRDSKLLLQLFVTDRNFLAECSETELTVLERRWGRETFQTVWDAANDVRDRVRAAADMRFASDSKEPSRDALDASDFMPAPVYS